MSIIETGERLLAESLLDLICNPRSKIIVKGFNKKSGNQSIIFKVKESDREPLYFNFRIDFFNRITDLIIRHEDNSIRTHYKLRQEGGA